MRLGRLEVNFAEMRYYDTMQAWKPLLFAVGLALLCAVGAPPANAAALGACAGMCADLAGETPDLLWAAVCASGALAASLLRRRPRVLQAAAFCLCAAAVPLALEGGGECSIRLIDCVGYMVEGAMGHEENDKPRMVKSPWFDEEIPFDLAAEVGGNHACGKFHIVLKVIFDVYVVRHQSRRVAAEGDELPDDAR